MTLESIPRQSESELRQLTVLAFDIRQFSAFTDTERTLIASDFRDAIEAAFRVSDLEHVWRERVFCQNSGDGIVAGFDHTHLRAIIDGVPRALQAQLRELSEREHRNVRMRLGIAVGPVQEIRDPRVDVAPNQTIIDACRIGDAKPVKQLLENADEHVTHLAVAVTATVMTSTIGPNKDWVRASEFVPVRIDMDDKHYHVEAFVHVPAPSGDLLRFGLTNLPLAEVSSDPPAEPLEELIKRGLGEIVPTAVQGQASAAGDVGRDLDDRSTRIGSIGRDAIGVGTGNRTSVGNSVKDDHSSTQHTNHGNVFREAVTARGGVQNIAGRDQRNVQRPERPDDEERSS